MNTTIFIREGIYYKNYWGDKVGPAFFNKDRWLKNFKWHWEISGLLFDDRGGTYASPCPFGDYLKCELDSEGNEVPKVLDKHGFPIPDENYCKDIVHEFIKNSKNLKNTNEWYNAVTDIELSFLESRFLHQATKRMKERAFLCKIN